MSSNNKKIFKLDLSSTSKLKSNPITCLALKELFVYSMKGTAQLKVEYWYSGVFLFNLITK